MNDNPQSSAPRMTAAFQRSLKTRQQHRIWPALAVFVVGFAFVIVGITRGEVAVVLQKAVRICLECIGLG